MRPPCFICCDAPGDAVFLDCGHGGACIACATVVRGGHGRALLHGRIVDSEQQGPLPTAEAAAHVASPMVTAASIEPVPDDLARAGGGAALNRDSGLARNRREERHSSSRAMVAILVPVIVFDVEADIADPGVDIAPTAVLAQAAALRLGREPQTAGAGGVGLCPMCRAPVAQVVRIGPDARTRDGSLVAHVLPEMYWQL
jgi:hypothetical protein